MTRPPLKPARIALVVIISTCAGLSG